MHSIYILFNMRQDVSKMISPRELPVNREIHVNYPGIHVNNSRFSQIHAYENEWAAHAEFSSVSSKDDARINYVIMT